MTVAWFAVPLDADLARAMRKAAKGQPISAGADAARRKLRAAGLMRVVEDWEAEHGELTEAELKAASKRRRARKRK
jgi:hypothetical protein